MLGMPGRPPPPPGPFVEPNLAPIEEAVRDITFPISKRDMLDQLREDDTLVLAGRNVDLRTFVKDLPDDFFESEDEFRRTVEEVYAAALDRTPEVLVAPPPPESDPVARLERLRDD